MKHSSKHANLMVRRKAETNRLPHKKPRHVWAWCTASFLCVIFTGVATLAVFEFWVWTVPPAVAGKWHVQEGGEFTGTFEFFRGGTLEANLVTQKRAINLKQRVAVQGRTLWITTPNTLKLTEETHKNTIRELTATSLILEFENGDVLKLARK